MYNKMLCFLVMWFLYIGTEALAHKQHVHQYIVREGYNLLRLQMGVDIPTMVDHVGWTEGYAGDLPFLTGLLTAGAWREDLEDVIYGYSSTNPPEIEGGGAYDLIAVFGGISPDPFVSTTHFWDAGAGDGSTISITSDFIIQSRYESRYDTGYHHRAINSLFVELGGNGILVTLNYERFIFRHFGVRIGYGGAYGVGTTVPIMFNYYIGNEKKLELGIGFVYLPTWAKDFLSSSGKTTLLACTLGYKHQPIDGGLMVKFALTPFYETTKNQIMFYGGIGLGLAF
jgi:hypothetical protein